MSNPFKYENKSEEQPYGQNGHNDDPLQSSKLEPKNEKLLVQEKKE